MTIDSSMAGHASSEVTLRAKINAIPCLKILASEASDFNVVKANVQIGKIDRPEKNDNIAEILLNKLQDLTQKMRV